MIASIKRIDRPAEEMCGICRENFSDTATKICSLLSCKHLFHQECLEQWMNVKPICPMCLEKVEGPVKWIRDWCPSPWKVFKVFRNGLIGTFCGLQLGKLITYGQNVLGPSREELVVSGLKCISDIMHLEDYTSDRSLDGKMLQRCNMLLRPGFWGAHFKEGCLDPLVEKLTKISQDLILPPIDHCTDFSLKTEEMNAFVLKTDSGYEIAICLAAGLALGVFGKIAIDQAVNHFYPKEKESSPPLLTVEPVYVDATT